MDQLKDFLDIVLQVVLIVGLSFFALVVYGEYKEKKDKDQLQ
jgi:hypothetical protein